MAVEPLPQCTNTISRMYSTNSTQCARWQGHGGPCVPYMAVIGAMADLVRAWHGHDEDDTALEEFVPEAIDAWRRRIQVRAEP